MKKNTLLFILCLCSLSIFADWRKYSPNDNNCSGSSCGGYLIYDNQGRIGDYYHPDGLYHENHNIIVTPSSTRFSGTIGFDGMTTLTYPKGSLVDGNSFITTTDEPERNYGAASYYEDYSDIYWIIKVDGEAPEVIENNSMQISVNELLKYYNSCTGNAIKLQRVYVQKFRKDYILKNDDVDMPYAGVRVHYHSNIMTINFTDPKVQMAETNVCSGVSPGAATLINFPSNASYFYWTAERIDGQGYAVVVSSLGYANENQFSVTYNIPEQTLEGRYRVKCRVTTDCGYIYTNYGYFTVKPSANFKQFSLYSFNDDKDLRRYAEVCNEDNSQILVKAFIENIKEGDPVAIYEKTDIGDNELPLSSLEYVTGGAWAKYNIPKETGTRSYYMESSGGCSETEIKSPVASITYLPAMTAGTVEDHIACNGEAVELTAGPAAGGKGEILYSWEKKDGAKWETVATGEKTTVLVNEDVIYRQKAKNSCGEVYTDNVNVSVYKLPTDVSIVPEHTEIESGGNSGIIAGSKVTDVDGEEAIYSWSRVSNGELYNYTDVSSRDLNKPAEKIYFSTLYTRVAHTACGDVSASANVKVRGILDGGKIGREGTEVEVCENQSFTVFAFAASGGVKEYTYKWYKSYDNGEWVEFSGTESSALVQNITGNRVQIKRVVIDKTGTKATSNLFYINIKNAPKKPVLDKKLIETCTGTEADEMFNVVTSSVDSSKYVDYHWEWMVSNGQWNEIQSEAGLSITPYPYTEGSTYYRIVAENYCGSTASESSELETYLPASAVTVTANTANACFGEEVDFNISYANSGTDDKFMWFNMSEFKVIANIEEAEKTLKWKTDNEGTNNIHAGVQRGNCEMVTDDITVTVKPPLQPIGLNAYEPENYTDIEYSEICWNTVPEDFVIGDILNGGKGPASYQWESSESGEEDDFTVLIGNTDRDLDFEKLQKTTYFRMKAENSCGAVYTEPYTVKVLDKIEIAELPADVKNQTLCYNTVPDNIAASLPVGAYGEDSFQWEWYTMTGSRPAFRGTGRSFPRNGFKQTESIEYYYVLTSTDPESGKSCPSVLGETVKLTVKPEITGNIIEEGQTISYNTVPEELTGGIVSNGLEGAAEYIWTKSTDGISFIAASETSSRNYQPEALKKTTFFRREATFGGCTADVSNIIEITVFDKLNPGKIAEESGNYNACYMESPGKMALISQPEGGEGQYYYQWQLQNEDGSYSNITGATADAYTVPPAEAGSRTFRLQVISAISKDTANTETLTFNTYEKINPGYIEHDYVLACKNSHTNLDLILPTYPTGGGGDYSFEWEQSFDGVEFIGTGFEDEFFSTVPNRSKKLRRRLFTEGCGEYVTNVFEIAIAPNIHPGTISGDQLICKGTVPELIEGTEATGGVNTYYVWEISYDNEQFQEVPNAKGISFKPSARHKNTYIRRRTSDSTKTCFSMQSNVVAIEVTEPLNPAEIAGDTVICTGQLSGYVRETEAPKGGSDKDLNRYWQISYNGSDYETMNSYNDLTFVPPMLADSSYYIRQAATNINCPVAYSDPVEIRALKKIKGGNVLSTYSTGFNCAGISPQPLNISKSSGGTSQFTYSWEKSHNNRIFSATGQNGLFMFPDTLYADQYYRVKVSDSICGSAYSDTLHVKIATGFYSGTLPAEQLVLKSLKPSPILQDIPARGGTGEYSYTWLKKDSSGVFALNGAEGPSYQAPVLDETTQFLLEVSDGCKTDTTNIHSVIVLDGMSQPAGRDTAICFGTSPGLITLPAVKGGKEPVRYRWEESADGKNWELADFWQFASLEIEKKLSVSMQYRRTAIMEGFDTVTSLPVKVRVMDKISRPVLEGGQQICYNTAPLDVRIKKSAEGGSRSFKNIWYTNREGNFANEGSGWQFQPGELKNNLKVYAIAKDDICGIAYSDTVEISVYRPFVAGKINAPESVSYGTETQINGTAPFGGSGRYFHTFSFAGNDSLFTEQYSEENSLATAMQLFDTVLVFRNDKDSICGSINTDTLKINVRPMLSGGGADEIIRPCFNGTPWLKPSAAEGGNGKYRFDWFKAGEDGVFKQLIYAVSDSLKADPADAPAYYKRRTISGIDTAYSGTILVQPYPQVKAAVIAGNSQVCPGVEPGAVTVELAPEGGDNAGMMVWQISKDAASWDDLSAHYFTEGVVVDSAFSLFVRLAYRNTCGNAVSEKVYIERFDTLSNNYIESNSRFVENGTAPDLILGSVPQGGKGVYSYLYQQSADSAEWKPVVNAGELKDYQAPGLFEAVYYRRIVSDACGLDTSAAVKIDILPEFLPGSVSLNHSVCKGGKGDTLRGTSPSGGSESYFYAWERSLDGSLWEAMADKNGIDLIPGTVQSDTWYRRKDSAEYLPAKYTNTVKISVLPVPAAPVITGKSMYCKGDVVSLKADTVLIEGRTYVWTIGGDYAVTSRTVSFEAESALGAIAVAYSPEGCRSESSELLISVNEAVADFTAETDMIGRTSAAHFIINTPDAVKAEWEFFDGDGSNRLDPFHYYYTPGSYDVRLIVENGLGCRDTLLKKDYLIVSSTGISTGGAQASVFPSPFAEKLTISYPGGFSYRLLSVAGTAIAEGTAAMSTEIDAHLLPEGLYFAEITADGRKSVIRIIKKK